MSSTCIGKSIATLRRLTLIGQLNKAFKCQRIKTPNSLCNGLLPSSRNYVGKKWYHSNPHCEYQFFIKTTYSLFV